VLTVTLVAFLALVAADLVTYTELRAVLLNEIDTALQSADAAVQATLVGHRVGFPGRGPPSGPSGQPPVPSARSGDDAPLAARIAEVGGASGAPGGLRGDGSERRPEGLPPPSGRSLCADNDVQGDAPGAFVEVRTPAGAVVDGDVCSALVAGARSYSPQLPRRIGGLHLGSDSPERFVYFSAPAAERDGPGFRVRASVIQGGRLGGDELLLALPLTGADHTLGGLVDIELAVTAGALAIALALRWWLVQRELLPLRRMESTADAIAGGDFADRVPAGDARTEVGRVARALNAMLARIEEAFAERDVTEAQLRQSEERLRRFVGDASHELRTPIAAVSAYAELFERSTGHEEDLPRVMRGIRAETARMARLVEDLLLLARLDDHRPPRREEVELVDVATAAVETARTVGPAWPVRLVASDAVEVLGRRGPAAPGARQPARQRDSPHPARHGGHRARRHRRRRGRRGGRRRGAGSRARARGA
jgi:signal transduction histidine kinase